MTKAYLENVDIINALQQIVEHNTHSFQSDFEYDKNTLMNAIFKPQNERTFMWLSRRNGTALYPQRDVYIHDTSQHNSWSYYGGAKSENVRAYLVEVLEKKEDTIVGNIVEMDYEKHLDYLATNSMQPTSVELIFRNPGMVRTFPVKEYRLNAFEISRRYGTLENISYQVGNPYLLNEVIRRDNENICDNAEVQTVEEYITNMEREEFESRGYPIGEKVYLNHSDARQALKFGLNVFAISQNGEETKLDGAYNFYEQVETNNLLCTNPEEKAFLKHLQHNKYPLFSEEENNIIYDSVLSAAKENKIENLVALDTILYKLEHLIPNFQLEDYQEQEQELERE